MVGRLIPVIVLSQKQLLSHLWDLPSCPTWAGAEGPGWSSRAMGRGGRSHGAWEGLLRPVSALNTLNISMACHGLLKVCSEEDHKGIREHHSSWQIHKPEKLSPQIFGNNCPTTQNLAFA